MASKPASVRQTKAHCSVCFVLPPEKHKMKLALLLIIFIPVVISIIHPFA